MFSFDQLVEMFNTYPYLSVGLVFLLCGLGLPLPEEIVLIAAGYVCFNGVAEIGPMMAASAVAIMVGDIIPFALGRWLGLPLLRVRPMKLIITPQRLARFNRWFRRRGNLVIFFSRFVAGIRVVAYFTAGTVKMPWWRFIILDLCGIALIVPPLVYVGYRFGGTIQDAISQVQELERGILYTVLGAGALVGSWFWLRWHRRQRLLVGTQKESYVEPSKPVVPAKDGATEDPAPEASNEKPDDLSD